MFNYNSHYFINIMSIKFFFIIIFSSMVFSSCISQEELQPYLIDQAIFLNYLLKKNIVNPQKKGVSQYPIGVA